MTGSRLTMARLGQLAGELSDRHIDVMSHLNRVRVLTGAHVDRLLDHPGGADRTAQRARQRTLARLVQLGLVTTLERRIGGVRAGSAGHVHALTTAGHTLLAVHRGESVQGRTRHAPTPSPMFLNHALDIAEIYVQLAETSRAGRFQVAHFRAPSWWPIGNGLYLRPDAYTVLATETYRDCWWLEIDRATESLPRLKTKCADYLDHATHGGTGPDGALPLVLFTAPTPKRCAVIAELITGLPPPAEQLLSVVLHDEATSHLTTALLDQ